MIIHNRLQRLSSLSLSHLCALCVPLIVANQCNIEKLRPEMRISNQVVSNAHKVASQMSNWERVVQSFNTVQKWCFTTKTWESRIYSHIHTLQCEMLQKGCKQYLTSHRSFPYKMQCTLRERRKDAINSLSICIMQLEEIKIHLLDVVDHVRNHYIYFSMASDLCVAVSIS